ncbi:Hypothetical protein PP7435_CHR3-0134 [Komagataella phaffii CBS 7435]|uniref:Uncharacterized protein n=1 Tax=Komagataella phaffii (strain ATCC 76273 / CBS 7435 / CECT 11047 / NRRL Y-11430 / Wegner 21-1) TaxID=981350 RepID=A0A1G4KQ77_KOMPC|nr:Hypothetical protein BQ9382_C3-0780 [Komagataella phaffii CBS 7435]SCV12161.1 Hypothetical protein PP7435_CHR3-0134 [Komagataella phaffii CBS 7435]
MQFSKVIVTISAAFAVVQAQNESNDTTTNGAVDLASSNAGLIGAAAAAVGAALLF